VNYIHTSTKGMLSLKFRPHRVTRTPHHQHRKTVIHGTRINSTAQQKGQNYTKLAKKKFKSASRPWKTSACAPYLRTSGAYARLWGAKPARLPNGTFMKLVGLPTTVITEISSAQGDKNSASSTQKNSHSWHKD
jgi:hypothetical protein